MNDVNSINYMIHLEPDLRLFIFTGITEIIVDAMKPVNEISLNILELAIRRSRVKQGDKFVDCPFLVDTKKEVLRVFLPEDMTGRIMLRFEYVGEINDRMAGLYRSKYESGGKVKYLAVSQFEESDARRAFPCFDHPAMKATFDIEMVIDKGLSAISNCPVKEEKPLDEGKKLVRFLQTPRMSPYLLFFGIGEFEFIEDPGEVVVRVAAIPGMTKQARFGLKFGRKSLEFLEDYYGIKYPIPKIDLIAVPDFAFGAMENWGAITFRENLLLYDPDITSKAGEERICEVIAHEMAHQWFGNLVTPSDWKYLWLNESFATYFGYAVVSNFHPEWDIWDQFLHGQMDVAMNRDALHETFPMEIPGGEHVVINAGTAPIIYNKGGSILRQIEGYMGKEGFKKGVRHYLKKHAFACTSTRHPWEDFEEVTEKPIMSMMKSWIEQPGFPVVEAKKKGSQLFLTQKRFTCLPNESEQMWLIPLSIRIFFREGGSKVLTALLDSKSKVVDLGSDSADYKVNHQQRGFYRVRYLEDTDLKGLGKRVKEKTLSSEDRWGIQNDLYAFVKSAEVSIDAYLEFLSYYSGEDAFLPLTSIAGNLFHAYLVFEGSRKKEIASTGVSLYQGVLANIGYEPVKGERHTTSILRDQIIWHAVLYGSEDVKKFAFNKFLSLMDGERIHPDIMKSVMQTGALNGGRDSLDWFEQRLTASESEHERMNMLIALGCFKEEALIERARQFTLDRVPERNKFVPIGQMANNPYAMPGLWEWYVSHIKEIEQFHPLHYERVIAGIVPLCGLGKEEQVKNFFIDYMSKKEKAKDVIKLSLERLDINSRMRRA